MEKTHLSHVGDEAGLTAVERVERGELLLEDLFEQTYDAPTAFYGLVRGIVTTLLPAERYVQLQEEGEVEALQLRVQPYYWQAVAQGESEEPE